MTTMTKPKPGWLPPADLDVLERTDELMALRDSREQAGAAFVRARARVGELLAERERLEARLLDGTATVRGRDRLAELTVEIARAPGEVAAAADELAGATIRWVRHVRGAADDAREQARLEEKATNSANGLDKARLYRGREIPGARRAIAGALRESQPLRDRQEQAGRLKADALAQLKRLLGVRGNGRFASAEIAEARRKFVERARAEAAAEVMSR